MDSSPGNRGRGPPGAAAMAGGQRDLRGFQPPGARSAYSVTLSGPRPDSVNWGSRVTGAASRILQADISFALGGGVHGTGYLARDGRTEPGIRGRWALWG
jgi:hypothetical protein